MSKETEILDYLLNPKKINKFSKYQKTFEYNVPPFLLEAMKRDTNFLVESSAYLFGKTLEIVILEKIRPEITSVWLSLLEVEELIVTNLPDHLHEVVLEWMDACESAVEAFLLKEKYDTGILYTNIQYIAESLCRKHKLYDIMVDGFTNKQIAIPQEVYTICSNEVLRHFQTQGYIVDSINPNMNETVNYVIYNDQDCYFVNVNFQIAPRDSKFQNYKLQSLYEMSLEHNAIPHIIGVQVECHDERAKKSGVMLLGSKYLIRTTNLKRLGVDENSK